MNNKKLLGNFIWRYSEKFLIQIIDLGVNIILARQLVPEAFGTIALINVFNNILQVFVTSGFSGALVQKKNVDNLDFSSVFYFNIFSSSILYSIMFLAAPTISAFYNRSELIKLIRVLGLTLIISGIKNIQSTYVTRHMLFKRFFFASLAGTIIAAICSIVMSYNGYGVWSLVALQLLDTIIDTIVLWFTVDWRPEKHFSMERIKNLIPFGSKILAFNLIDKIYSNLRSLIIGKVYSAGDLAFFEKGRKYPNTIYSNIASTFNSVLFSAISKEQDNKDKIKNLLSKSIKTSVYLEAPLLFGLAASADSVIKIILTDKWLPAVPFLRIFCFVVVVDSIRHICTIPIKSLGLGNELIKINLIEKTISIIIIIFTMHKGTIAIAIGISVASIINLLLPMFIDKKHVSYSFRDLLTDTLPSILLATIMAIIVFSFSFLGFPQWQTLLLQIIVGGIFYIGISLLIRNEILLNLFTIIQKELLSHGIIHKKTTNKIPFKN